MPCAADTNDENARNACSMVDQQFSVNLYNNIVPIRINIKNAIYRYHKT